MVAKMGCGAGMCFYSRMIRFLLFSELELGGFQ